MSINNNEGEVNNLHNKELSPFLFTSGVREVVSHRPHKAKTLVQIQNPEQVIHTL